MLGLPCAAVILPLFSFVILLAFSIWGLHTRHIDIFKLVAISTVALIIFPLMFFANDGLHGGMTSYFMAAIVCIALVLRGKTCIIVFIIAIIEYSMLFIIYRAAPHIFLHMSHKTAFIDHLCSMLLTSIITFTFSYIVAHQNSNDRDTIQKRSNLYEQQANTDELTGLYNRRYFNNFLKLAISTLGDTGNLHIAMFDIDDFKDVNDKYGHPFGDTVLKQLADILKEKENDAVKACRYGGEEFLLLISKKDREEALQIAETILEDTRSKIKIGTDGFVTVSAGFMTCEAGMAYDALLEEVDKRLYAAKSAGKNRVVSK